MQQDKTTAVTQPPADAKAWRWRYVLERSGPMATERGVFTWYPKIREWRRLGSPRNAWLSGWRYLRPASPDEVDDQHA